MFADMPMSGRADVSLLVPDTRSIRGVSSACSRGWSSPV